MEVKLLKDWAGYKKSALIQITDKDVLDKGFEIGLFEKENQRRAAEEEHRIAQEEQDRKNRENWVKTVRMTTVS